MEGEKKRRRKFDKEFKIQAVKLLLESGNTVEEVASDLGIYWGNLARWKRKYRRDAEEAFPGMGKLKPEDEEAEERDRGSEAGARHIKKSLGHFLKTSKMKYKFIERHRCGV